MSETEYKSRCAGLFRGILNDLKRNAEVAAQELEVGLEEIEEYLSGERVIPFEIAEKASLIWPVNERDFYSFHDDAPDGVVLMREKASVQSSRILQRGGKDYYEYRDSAMSRVAMIRPEWIKVLNHVENNDPLNPSVLWNKGHFLYQFTYFIGEINYYYEWNGERFCVPMDTGDSVFGMPYAPHSFSSRNKEKPGVILALTYGGTLSGDAQHELSITSPAALDRIALPAEVDERQAAQLLRFAADMSLPISHLSKCLGLPAEECQNLLHSSHLDRIRYRDFSRSFGIPEREILATADDTRNGVVIVKSTEAPSWDLPDTDPSYKLKKLANSCNTPYSHSFEVTPKRRDGESKAYELCVSLHQFVYVAHDAPVILLWEHSGTMRRETLFPGDSLYMKPFVKHSFMRLSADHQEAKLIVLRVGGKLVGNSLQEASLMGTPVLKRLAFENSQWYDPS